MRAFNNIQELWDFCYFCPICQKDGRDLDVRAGPEGVFKIDLLDKSGSTLNLYCTFNNRKNEYSVTYTINCLDNTFNVEVTDVKTVRPDRVMPEAKVKEAYFFFYLQSKCPTCQCASVSSSDLEFDILDKKISNIELEREQYWLLQEDTKYHITVHHDRKIMQVKRCFGIDEFDFREDDKSISLPIVNLDLANQPKVVNKIKTLILFS